MGGEASGEGIGEVGGDALHRVTERGGDAAEEVEVAERRWLVALGDEVGAGQEEVHQLETTVLLLHTCTEMELALPVTSKFLLFNCFLGMQFCDDVRTSKFS